MGLVVGISGGGEGMLGGRLVLLNVTGILWTSWLGPEWRTERNGEKKSSGFKYFTVWLKKT